MRDLRAIEGYSRRWRGRNQGPESDTGPAQRKYACLTPALPVTPALPDPPQRGRPKSGKVLEMLAQDAHDDGGVYLGVLVDEHIPEFTPPDHCIAERRVEQAP